MQRVKVEVEPTRSELATAMLNSKTTPQAHFHVKQTHILMKSFARGLVLKQRLKSNPELPIVHARHFRMDTFDRFYC